MGSDPSTARIFDDSDTMSLHFPLGARVRCVMGDMKGLEGTVVGTRTGARILVRVARGVLIEVPRVSLRDASQDE